MRSKGKRKAAPGIVPRFLKGAVTIGAIPAIAAACGQSHPRMQPVVAYMASPPAPPDEASVQPNPPVVAAYQQPEVQPVVAAYAIDAGVDAAPKKKGKTTTKVEQKRPPPPVVAAMMPKPQQ
jgi:hypothetical protein